MKYKNIKALFTMTYPPSNHPKTPQNAPKTNQKQTLKNLYIILI
jgi:hypothetical protein